MRRGPRTRVRGALFDLHACPDGDLREKFLRVFVSQPDAAVGGGVAGEVAGVHADGDNKDNLYCNDLQPERFGRKREYALGKNSGKANIEKNLEELGLDLTPEQTRMVTQRITELGDRKETVTTEDLPFIVADALKSDPKTEKINRSS